MSFSKVLQALDMAEINRRRQEATTKQVEALLRQDQIADQDLALLFSPAADGLLEQMAERAAFITAHRFGRIINLYAPLYVSNECVNNCVYCGFAHRNQIERITLSVEEVIKEANILLEEGFRHVLLVSGEAPCAFSVDDLEKVVRELAGKFASIAIEVFPMSADHYRRLEKAGVDGLVLYQETYDPAVYARCHFGPKADYAGRLAAIEAGAEAGFRSLGVGALLGLADWRNEAFITALHGRYLARRFWKSKIAFSFPRLRPAEGGFAPPYVVTDRDLVQMITGLRLAIHDAEIVVSTREPAGLRDSLIPLGVTRMSAGSKTSPGGYQDSRHAGRQFSVDDQRGPQEVALAIEKAGREPVWKDFDTAFIQQRDT